MNPENGGPLHVLIVDDDVVDRMVVVRAFRSHRWEGEPTECVEAPDAATAFEQLRHRAFDCIFLDFNLPDGNGLDVLRQLRRSGIRTPVIMLTGQGDEELAVELMKAGASDYLPKGALTAERLEQSLRAAVRVYRAELRLRAAEEAREAAIAARSRFYAAMSHELRTPINAILGYNDLLLASVYGPLTAQQRRGLDGAQRAARHLLELVNDVLDLSKLEAGKMELQVEEVDLAALLEDLLATIAPLAADHECDLTVEVGACPQAIVTDPRRARQILLNLLSNAVKFGRGRPVRVRCVAAAEGGVEIEVIDQGPGIAAEDLPRVFEDFVQLGEAEVGGTGLGLPISKRLAELLQGRLEAESTVGAGSTFRLVLPAVPRLAPDPGSSALSLVSGA